MERILGLICLNQKLQRKISMKIRKYKKNDFDSVIKLVHKTMSHALKSHPEYWSEKFLHEWDIKKNKEKIKSFFDQAQFMYVALDGEKYIGFVRGTYEKGHDPREKRYHLNTAFVLPPYQGKGVGSALIKRVLGDLKGIGATRVRLFSSIPAISFYKRHGFKKITGKSTRHGIMVQPMHLYIKDL